MKRKLYVLFLAVAMLCSLTSCVANTERRSSTGSGDSTGYGGVIRVKVTLSADRKTIEAIDVTEQNENAAIGGRAIQLLRETVLENQSVSVDGITGATLASNGFLNAVMQAIGAAGGSTADFRTPPEPDPTPVEEQTLDVDVVVVGAGGAGMTAAITAARAGKKVVIMEKTAITGGNTARATEGMNVAGTDYQNDNGWNWYEMVGMEKALEYTTFTYPELGKLVNSVQKEYDQWLESDGEDYFDSPNLYTLDTLIGGDDINSMSLASVLAENSADALKWLEGIGASIRYVSFGDGASVKRLHRPLDSRNRPVPIGSHIVPLLEQACIDNGVEIIFNAPVTEILMDNGTAVGVKATGYTVHANAVILATGGFGGNQEMLAEEDSSFSLYKTASAPGITGDGIKMAQHVGASTIDMDQIQAYCTVEKNTATPVSPSLLDAGGILLNVEGLRFCNETSTPEVVAAAELIQTDHCAYLILDQKIADDSDELAQHLTQGYVVQGNTLSGLAKSLGLPREILITTVGAWNNAVAAQQDTDFGRTSFAEPLDTAPFYAIRVTPGVLHTMGGIRINSTTQVLDSQNTAIPGLFAAGEVTGGLHGANRLSGNAITECVVFGQIAGTSAANFADSK